MLDLGDLCAIGLRVVYKIVRRKVKVAGHLSNTRSINIGVPQRSVLGQILFLIYLNSIFDQKMVGKIIAFADDLGIAYKADSPLNFVCDIHNDILII